MNLLLLAAVKVARDRQQADARRRRRAREEARKKKKAPSQSKSYSSKGYSENEYFNMVIAEDPILVAFFNIIEKKGEEIDLKDVEEIRKRVEEKLKLQVESVEKVDEVLKKITQSGLEVTEISDFYSNITIGEKVINSKNRAFGDKGEYSKGVRGFSLTYKGIPLESRWFAPENRDVNPFENNYNNYFEAYKDIDEQIQAKEKEIKVQERRVKFAVLNKYDKEDELKRLEKELEVLKSRKVYMEECKFKMDAFNEITPEQKELLHRYYELVSECRAQGADIDKEVDMYNAITDKSYRYEYKRQESAKGRNKWERTLQALIEDGELSEEIVDAVDTILSEENIGYNEYGEGYSDYDMQRNGYSKDFQGIVIWYIDSRKEKIALKALNRKEAAYKALEDEYKKLAEVAGLVDRAEELEKKVPEKEGDEINGE